MGRPDRGQTPGTDRPTQRGCANTLDGFVEALRQIAAEARSDPEVLRSAPHTSPVRRLMASDDGKPDVVPN